MRLRRDAVRRSLLIALGFGALGMAAVLASDTAHSGTAPAMVKSPTIQNVWLTRHGDKIPPPTCLASNDVGSLTETLTQETEPQALAAFAFEVEFDYRFACIVITPGPEFDDVDADCTIDDAITNTGPRGTARISCQTAGKGLDIDELAPLAQIDVYPQPDLYSMIKPSQDNTKVIELENMNCALTDEQAAPIPVASCDGAHITFRYLEADVNPDCVVDAKDAQSVAFRWGATAGSTIYRDFLDVHPSGSQTDGKIDVNDLQFVFGRFGSTCEDPKPPQPPINPKA